MVDEHVLAALLRDEAVPLAVVEPLHGTLRHVTTFFVADGSPALREPSWLTAVSSSKTARTPSNRAEVFSLLMWIGADPIPNGVRAGRGRGRKCR